VPGSYPDKRHADHPGRLSSCPKRAGQGNSRIRKVLPIISSPGDRVYYGVGASLGHAFAVGKEI
jgi:hypothetical protein